MAIQLGMSKFCNQEVNKSRKAIITFQPHMILDPTVNPTSKNSLQFFKM